MGLQCHRAMVAEAVPLLVIVTTVGAVVVPTSTFPKLTVTGLSMDVRLRAHTSDGLRSAGIACHRTTAASIQAAEADTRSSGYGDSDATQPQASLVWARKRTSC